MKKRPSLREVQAQMRALVFGPEARAKSLGVLRAPRVARDRTWFYREMTTAAMQGVSEAVYPLTRREVLRLRGEGCWRALGSAHLQGEPPTSYLINEAVRGFPRFLLSARALGGRATRAWISELAAYEWSSFEARASRDPRPGDFVNPSVVVAEFSTDVPEWVARGAFSPGGRRPRGGPRARASGERLTVVFFRPPGGQDRKVLAVGAASGVLLDEWKKGRALRATAAFAARAARIPKEAAVAFQERLAEELCALGLIMAPGTRELSVKGTKTGF